MEIERKFLVKEIPFNLEQYEKFDIEQGYLNFNPEIRLRKKNNKCYLTVKGNGTIAREEYETEISENTYLELSNKIQGLLIRKTRYNIPLKNDYLAELDIYLNLEGLDAMVEVEFLDIKSANEFIVPNWFGQEVTNDNEFKNKNLIIIKQK